MTEMGVTTAGEAIAAALVMISNTQPLCGATKVVAIDGPSGAGKTDFAAGLARRITIGMPNGTPSRPRTSCWWRGWARARDLALNSSRP